MIRCFQVVKENLIQDILSTEQILCCCCIAVLFGYDNIVHARQYGPSKMKMYKILF